MILECSYDKILYVLDLINKNEIASLNVTNIPDDESGYAMEITLVSDYPEVKQDYIRNVLIDALPVKLNLIRNMNMFLENFVSGKVKNFDLKFTAVNVKKAQFTYSYVFSNDITSPIEDANDLKSLLEKLQITITHMGVDDVKIKNVFRKEIEGRTKKSIPITIGELVETLRKELE